MAHLNLFAIGPNLELDLQMPSHLIYEFGLIRGERYDFGPLSSELSQTLLEGSKIPKTLKVNDRLCNWQKAQTILGFGTARLRALADCGAELKNIDLSFEFLKNVPDAFFIDGVLMVGESSKKFRLDKKEWQIKLRSNNDILLFWLYLTLGLLGVVTFVVFKKVKKKAKRNVKNNKIKKVQT